MVLNGQTCMFTKEYDPTRLTTDVAGKLARYARTHARASYCVFLFGWLVCFGCVVWCGDVC